MNENRQESIESLREKYATPTYERFVFEASGLMMASEEPAPAGDVALYSQDRGIDPTSGNSPW